MTSDSVALGPKDVSRPLKQWSWKIRSAEAACVLLVFFFETFLKERQLVILFETGFDERQLVLKVCRSDL